MKNSKSGVKIFIDKWWKSGTKNFSIRNYKKPWKECGNKPKLTVHHNGGKRKNGDICFDISFIIGYTIINYTNFDLQRTWKKSKKNDTLKAQSNPQIQIGILKNNSNTNFKIGYGDTNANIHSKLHINCTEMYMVIKIDDKIYNVNIPDMNEYKNLQEIEINGIIFKREN